MRDNGIMQCVKTVEALVGTPAHAPEPKVEDKLGPIWRMLHGSGVHLSQRTLEQLEHQQQHRQVA